MDKQVLGSSTLRNFELGSLNPIERFSVLGIRAPVKVSSHQSQLNISRLALKIKILLWCTCSAIMQSTGVTSILLLVF